MESAIRDRILCGPVCVSLDANAVRKGMNLSFLSPALGKSSDRAGKKIKVEGKLLTQTSSIPHKK